mmetsp:Transcript_28376/g.60506  ORF Transcript_28376/g.60506 Transcript_28376/m.60506 type:complete len:290 (+) Transcript_28376:148-1017(+)
MRGLGCQALGSDGSRLPAQSTDERQDETRAMIDEMARGGEGGDCTVSASVASQCCQKLLSRVDLASLDATLLSNMCPGVGRLVIVEPHSVGLCALQNGPATRGHDLIFHLSDILAELLGHKLQGIFEVVEDDSTLSLGANLRKNQVGIGTGVLLVVQPAVLAQLSKTLTVQVVGSAAVVLEDLVQGRWLALFCRGCSGSVLDLGGDWGSGSGLGHLLIDVHRLIEGGGGPSIVAAITRVGSSVGALVVVKSDCIRLRSCQNWPSSPFAGHDLILHLIGRALQLLAHQTK